jgi:hypothetical protein
VERFAGRGRRVWKVGGDAVELVPEGSGWAARVRRADWGGTPLVLDGHFAARADAVAWCRKMACVRARYLVDAA